MNINKQEQVETQEDSNASALLPNAEVNDSKDLKAPSQVASEHIKCVSPMTFSQRMHQSRIEVAKELNRVIKANSLEELRKLLEKALEI